MQIMRIDKKEVNDLSKIVIAVFILSFLAACVVVHDHGVPPGHMKPAPGKMKKW